jgi:hypothetical protein
MENATPAIELSEATAIELVALIGAACLWFAFIGFFMWFAWKIIRAQLRVPEELAGIRAALEKIVERLDQRR